MKQRLIFSFWRPIALVVSMTVGLSSFSFGAPMGQTKSKINSQNYDSSDSTTHLTLIPGLIGRTQQDESSKSQWMGGRLRLKLKREQNSSLGLNLDFSMYVTTGQYSSRYLDEGKPPNYFLIHEASLSLRPMRVLSFDIGVMSPHFINLPSTFDDVAFPGARLRIQTQGDLAHFVLYGMQSTPTSSTKGSQSSEEGQGSLTTLGVRVGPSDSYKAPLALDLALMGFQFNNLENTAVASDSRYSGNTVIGSGSNSRFVYQFRGYEGSGKIEWRFNSNESLFWAGSYLQNQEAPTESNKGYSSRLGFSAVTWDWVTSPIVGYYYNESDTLPAAYASQSTGSNNRFGWFGKLVFEQMKDHSQLELRYIRANEIEDQPFTADRDSFYFYYKVPYEIL